MKPILLLDLQLVSGLSALEMNLKENQPMLGCGYVITATGWKRWEVVWKTMENRSFCSY